MKKNTCAILIGFGIWLLATVVFRLYGQYFFITSNLMLMVALYIFTAIFLFGLSRLFYRLFGLSKNECLAFSILMVLPGMVMDGFIVSFYPMVFTNLTPNTGNVFGGWLLIAYSSVILSSITKNN